jgi:N-acetyl-alpha-D-muramate 1-phosphate uridylyltransferase
VGLAGVVLAAGAGTRLRPLTRVRPKPLCPVGDRALVDRALDRVGAVAEAAAVNVHHGRDQLEAHLTGVHVSIEEREALGTAGALGQLRDWIDGRAVVVVNGDTWTDAPLADLLDGWDGERMRLLVAGAVDVRRPRLAGALLPWSAVEGLSAEPSGLWELRWAEADARGTLDWVARRARFADCGTPGSYLAANLAWSGGVPVAFGAAVHGTIERSVVWPGLEVGEHEHLDSAIRYAEGRTVLVR